VRVADATPNMQVTATVIGTPNPQRLADFYQALLEWNRLDNKPGWVKLQPSSGGPCLSFQYEASFMPPEWPAVAGAQHMMMHLDIAANDLEAAVSRAEELGARRADYQPQPHVRVMLDPDGHPFCLFTRGS
jgi:catechol 2,3-dioxygenase-like lactoylglutathione lyase family enzyme